MRSEIEQHLRRELEAGVCTLDVFELEAVALCAYAFHAHALSGELPSPRALATRVGLTVRPGALPPGTPGMLVGRTIVYCARTRARGLVILHELAHYLLRDRQHSHGDVVALTLVLALPDPVLRSALNAWELSTDACVARQPWVPRWAIEERIVLAAPQLRPVGETG